jgi:hypothetical protein
MNKLIYPQTTVIEPEIWIVVIGNGLWKRDNRPGAFCPIETRFPDEGNAAIYIALLSPQVMGAIGTTTPARRAAWAWALKPRHVGRFLRKWVIPLLKQKKEEEDGGK